VRQLQPSALLPSWSTFFVLTLLLFLLFLLFLATQSHACINKQSTYDIIEMGQSTSNLSGPNLESSSSATRTGHHRTRQHHQYGHSKRSVVSTSENEHFRGYVRSSHTRTSTHHDQTERARRLPGHRDQNLNPLTNVDGNARQITVSSSSKVQERRKPHAKSKEPKSPDDGRALKPRRNQNRKTEPQRREKTNDKGKSHSHAHSTPSSSNNQRRDSKDKSGAIVNITELSPEKSKPKRKPKSEKHETKDCMVCVETRSIGRFPQRAVTAQCTHEVNTCRHCLRGWIRSEFKSKMWNQLACPECRASMEYEDVKEFAPPEVFRR
jgi:hypothetical protein